ncbi:MAG: FkbM family methyltransferase [Gemmatimonadota bacterium]
MSIAERLRMVSAREGSPNQALQLNTWLLRRLRVDSTDSPYFDLGNIRLYYRPERAGGDDAEALRGALLVITEAFIEGPDFFRGEVTVHAGDTVLDLGGNLGTSAILFSDIVGRTGQVYSLEPVFHRVLRRNMRANDIGNVEVIPSAVGSKTGVAEFTVTDFGLDSRRTSPSFGDSSGSLSVPMTTIDEFVDARHLTHVDFIKLDVEGSEEDALLGARRTLERYRPKLTVASYHTDRAGEPQHPKLVALLHECGYETLEVDDERIYAWPE